MLFINKIHIYILILNFLILINTANAEIAKFSDLSQIENIIQTLDRDTLVIFDVDHVLIMPNDESTLNRSLYRKNLWQRVQKRLSVEKANILYSIILLSSKWRLIDPHIINILNYLQNYHIPTIALTSFNTGKIGMIKKMEDLRIRDLQSVSIDFTHLTPFKDEIVAHELRSKFGAPILKSGIILTANHDKAIVLEYFLRHINYYPKTIFFVDDQLKNLESLEKLCNKLKIKFYGFHYTAALRVPEPIIDMKIENLRFKILETDNLWLTYDEIRNRKLSKLTNYH